MIESFTHGPSRRLIFIRHGEALNATGRCVGHADLPLSESGRETVQRFARALRTHYASECFAEAWQIVSSDLTRTRASAEIVAAELGLTSTEDVRLREMNFGEWDGLAWSDIEASDGERCRAWMEQWTRARPPAGETVADVTGRVSEWLHSTRALPSHITTIAVVTHAGWIRSALCHLTGAPIEQMFDFPADYARATVVEVREGAAIVLLLNDSLSGQS